MEINRHPVTSTVNEPSVPANEASKTKCFPFDELAPELRNAIYHYALIRTGEKSIDLTKGSLPDLAVGLLTTSTKLRQEARPIFLSVNTFHIDCTDIDRKHLEAQIRKLGNSNLSMIRKYSFIYQHKTQLGTAGDVQSETSQSGFSRPLRHASIHLHLLSHAPFHTIGRTHDHFGEAWDSSVAYFMEDMFSYRKIRKLAMMDVVDIACFVQRCGHSWSNAAK